MCVMPIGTHKNLTIGSSSCVEEGRHQRGALVTCAGASTINTLHLIDSFNYSELIYVNPFRSEPPRDIVGYNYVGGDLY